MQTRAVDDRPARRARRTTDDGVAAIGEVPAVLAEVMNAHLAGFSKTEWQALKTYLARMLATGDAMRDLP